MGKKKPIIPPVIDDRPVKVLVVDDDEFLSNIYVISLKRYGFDVSVARNGEECLAATRKDKPDIILLDLMMPKMDGFETLENLKKDDKLKDIPVMVLSSLGQKEDTGRAMSLGAADYLRKTETLPNECLRKVYDVLKLYK